jgi:hypothetical protein
VVRRKSIRLVNNGQPGGLSNADGLFRTVCSLKPELADPDINLRVRGLNQLTGVEMVIGRGRSTLAVTGMRRRDKDVVRGIAGTGQLLATGVDGPCLIFPQQQRGHAVPPVVSSHC